MGVRGSPRWPGLAQAIAVAVVGVRRQGQVIERDLGQAPGEVTPLLPNSAIGLRTPRASMPSLPTAPDESGFRAPLMGRRSGSTAIHRRGIER